MSEIPVPGSPVPGFPVPGFPVVVVGAGSVGRALGAGLAAGGVAVSFALRDPEDPRHADLVDRRALDGAARGAASVVLAIPAGAVVETVPRLGLVAGQVVLDATNAVGAPPPGGHPTMGDAVASVLPDDVALAKAFNTIGAEHLGAGAGAFLPVAGDPAAVAEAQRLAAVVDLDAVVVGGRDAFDLVEAHARLWIRLAIVQGLGRDLALVRRPAGPGGAPSVS